MDSEASAEMDKTPLKHRLSGEFTWLARTKSCCVKPQEGSMTSFNLPRPLERKVKVSTSGEAMACRDA